MKDFIKLRLKENWVFFLLVATILAGCAGSPDITSTDQSPDQPPFSAADVYQIMIEHPQFVSGDFFREREQTSLKTVEKASTEDNKTAEKQAVEAQTKETATAIAATSTASSVEGGMKGMKIKVALLIDRRQVQADNERLLTDSADTNATKFPVVLITPKEMKKSLSQNKTSNPTNLDRVSRELSIYPGVRMLVLVEKFTLPETFPGSARAVVTFVDAGILQRYPPLEVTMTLATEADAELFAETVANTALDHAVDRSTIMPWFCRSFSQEEQVWYVNAGKDSGLQTGDRLNVVTGGKLVKAPSGIPAGWIPGDSKGTLRVDRHFGRDLAACSLVDGSGPGDDDLLMK